MILGKAGKQSCNVVPKNFHWNGVGCRGPVQWLLCFIAMFWMFEFVKISIQNVRKAMANFASKTRSSKQNKMFVLYKQLIALSSSNRRPRIFKYVYRTIFSSNCIVPWGCRRDSSCFRKFFVNLCWGRWSISYRCLFLFFCSNCFQTKSRTK